VAAKIYFCLSLIYAKLRVEVTMPRKSSRPRQRKAKVAGDFRISTRRVVRSNNERKKAAELDEMGILHTRGAPTLFAVARDPWTIFICWSIDWPTIFARTAPVHRQIYLRVHRADASQEKSVAVEPMAGYCYVNISRPISFCHVEIGYYQPADVWNSVAVSEEVGMPPHKRAETADVDLATIPFHLRFQQLLDLFGASDGDALAEIISRFQSRALRSNERRQMKFGERKILSVIGASTKELGAARRAFLDQADSEIFRQRVQALLGFSPTSPSRGFGESGWTSIGS
jgi:hypothetical protein